MLCSVLEPYYKNKKEQSAKARAEYGGRLGVTRASLNLESCPSDTMPAQEGQSAEAARACPACGGRLGIKLSRAGGGFIGCGAYPACSFARSLAPAEEGGADDLTRAPDAPPTCAGATCQPHAASHVCWRCLRIAAQTPYPTLP